MVTQVRTYRLRLGVKQNDLARKIGVGRSTISEIEHGKTIPSVMIALKIAGYFHCCVEDLFHLSPQD